VKVIIRKKMQGKGGHIVLWYCFRLILILYVANSRFFNMLDFTFGLLQPCLFLDSNI
jgi:hypothetical protein